MMAIKSKFAPLIGAVVVALGVSACAVQSDEASGAGATRAVSMMELEQVERAHGIESRESEVEPFAAFETENFGLVEFFEPESGELLVSVTRPGEPADPFEGMGPEGLYEELAGEPLPARFLAKADAAKPADVADVAEEAGPVADPYLKNDADPRGYETQAIRRSAATAETISASDFCDRLANPYRCWSGTGTSYAQKRDGIVWSWVHSYKGTVRQRVRAKNIWGNWVTKLSVDVSKNVTSSVFYANSNTSGRLKESRVDEASGDGYHHAMQFM